jgi:hypothetical protein
LTPEEVLEIMAANRADALEADPHTLADGFGWLSAARRFLSEPLVVAANQGRRQIFRFFSTRKRAKDAAAHSAGGPFQKKGQTVGPERHGDGLPHFHDGWHNDRCKANIHYCFPE